MSKESGLSEKITDNIVELIKNSSLFDKILTLTNKANNTMYSIGSFCLVVTVCTVMNYNKTQKTLDLIQNNLSNISESSYKKNKNIENLDINVANIQEDISRIKNNIYEMKIDLKNLLLSNDFIRCREKTVVDRSTSINSLEFLSIENSYREKCQELSIQNEEKCEINKEEKIDNKNTLDYNAFYQELINEDNDLMNECYDIIPCNNIKKYSNTRYNLFFY